MSSVRALTIDPTIMSQEQSELLKALMLSEEAKPKGNRTKKFEQDQPYLFTYNNQSYEITLSNTIVRRKKRYKQMVVLGPDEPIPLTKERSTLYFKKSSDGTVTVETYLDAPKTLNSEQLAALQKLNFDVPPTTKKNNKDTRKLFSLATRICGYETKYIYQVLDTDTLGEGAFGEVYNSPGKLEHGNNGMEYIDYTSARSPEEAHRGPRKPKVAKVQLVSPLVEEKNKIKIESLDTENELWQRDKDSQTKKSTRIKNSQGLVTEDIMVQRKFDGVELEEAIKSNTLSTTERYNLAILLLEELLKLHNSNIIHRDIKPNNIIVNSKTVKIVDLGSAQDVASNKKTGIQGTPLWISPEQWMGRSPKQVNDFYAMGLVLRELFGDKVFKERYDALPRINFINSINEYLCTGYYLNVSMKKPELPPHVIAELGPEKTERIIAVLYGMSMTKENERLLAKTALSILDGSTPLPLEEKSYPSKKITPRQEKRIASYLNNFDDDMKRLFLDEVAQKLEIYTQSAKENFPDELRRILDEYNILIEKAPPKVLIKGITDIFNALKNITPEKQDEIIVILRKNVVDLQENFLESTINSVKDLSLFLNEMEEKLQELMNMPNSNKESVENFIIELDKGLEEHGLHFEEGNLIFDALEELEFHVMKSCPFSSTKYEEMITEAALLWQKLESDESPLVRLKACINQANLLMKKTFLSVEEKKEENASPIPRMSTAATAIILANAQDGDAKAIVKSSISAPEVVKTASHSSETTPSLQTKKVTEKSIEIAPEERETSKLGTRKMG